MPTLTAVAGALLGAGLTFLLLRLLYAARLAGLVTERDLLRERVVDLEATVGEGAQAAALLGPVQDALGRVERQVGVLERDRSEQYAALGERLAAVVRSSDAVRAEAASLAGALQAAPVRGQWGEVQLRRILEHSGLLARCDFQEQATMTTDEGRRVRPDVVVHLPGRRVLAVDAKAPMSSFLAAQADGLAEHERRRLLGAHAAALRGHVEQLAAKEYWSALRETPELVVCFIPSDAVLGAALAADPELLDRALQRRVVLTAPGTLFAVLRVVAAAWQQEGLTDSARELLGLGRTLYARLSGLGGHVARLGATLQRSVEGYNALVGSLESRVLVTARRMSELGLVDDALPDLPPVTAAPRPLSSAELVRSELEEVLAADRRSDLAPDLPDPTSLGVTATGRAVGPCRDGPEGAQRRAPAS